MIKEYQSSSKNWQSDWESLQYRWLRELNLIENFYGDYKFPFGLILRTWSIPFVFHQILAQVLPIRSLKQQLHPFFFCFTHLFLISQWILAVLPLNQHKITQSWSKSLWGNALLRQQLPGSLHCCFINFFCTFGHFFIMSYSKSNQIFQNPLFWLLEKIHYVLILIFRHFDAA